MSRGVRVSPRESSRLDGTGRPQRGEDPSRAAAAADSTAARPQAGAGAGHTVEPTRARDKELETTITIRDINSKSTEATTPGDQDLKVRAPETRVMTDEARRIETVVEAAEPDFYPGTV